VVEIAARPRHPAHATVALEILTLNVWGLPWPIAKHRRRRFADIARSFAGRTDHLVGLQELWADAVPHLRLEGLRRGRRSRDSGLALGGTLASGAAADVHHFRAARGTDVFKAKGVLEGELNIPTLGRVRVLVTHLQAHREHAKVRASQVDEILERNDSRPVVLMGDFNFYDDHPEDRASERRLEEAGFVDVAVEVGRPEPTYDPENPYVRGSRGQRFDRILVRGGQGVSFRSADSRVLQHETPLSDHHPLWARVEARRDPSPGS